MNEKKNQSTSVPVGIASLLTYFIPFFGGLLFLFLEKKNRTIRFHAVQSILLWIFFVVISAIFFWIPVLNVVLWLFVLIVWIFMMYQALMEREYELPVIGGIARSQIGIKEEETGTGDEGTGGGENQEEEKPQ
jgi:uncharacterized membrane protein